MARTPAQRKALETKALAAPVKSEGMRMLLQAGYSVAEVKALFRAPYGFVYGVAKRANGGNPPEGASRRAPTAKATRNARQQAREQKAAPAARTPKARAQTPAQPKRGRGRPPITDPKAIASRSPEAQRSAARRAAAGAKTVVAAPTRRVRTPKAAPALAAARPGSAVARVAAKLNARKAS